MPESGCEVDGGEEQTSGVSNLVDALRDVLHGVLVLQGLAVQGSKVLNHSESSVLLGHTEQRAVVFGSTGLEDSKFESFSDAAVQFIPLRVRDLELLDVDWIPIP